MQRRRCKYKLNVKSKSKEKEQKLRICAGVYRLICNLELLQKEFIWWHRRKRASYTKQCAELIELKKEFSWLCEVHSQVLQQALRNLDRAYRNSFAGRANYPKLKKKKKHLSFRYIQRVKISNRLVQDISFKGNP